MNDMQFVSSNLMCLSIVVVQDRPQVGSAPSDIPIVILAGRGH